MGERLERGNETVKIVLDQRVFLERKDSDGKITSRLPDIMVTNIKYKTIFITEVAISAEELIKDKFAEKLSKYVPLCKHLREKHPGYKVKNFAFVIGQLGIIQRDSDSNLRAFREG